MDKLKNGKLFELKKRNTAPEAAKYQVLYYLLKLREKGINTTGIIKYKENNRIEEIVLTPEDEKTLKVSIREIEQICSLNMPPSAKKVRYCKNCSYYRLCFS